ncbi:MAG TPA: TIGR01777 family oxidoreductase [Thermoanaerobaculia bacterium]|nr:TIGR01777 family oxidoreductase [Thermoanaerobaculia bacterium]
MKIVIAGGSGHLGRLLAESFHRTGEEVVVLSRTPRMEPWRVAGWEQCAAEIDGADVVINLAGRSVDCRYDEAHKREILESRVFTARQIGVAVARAKKPPRVWLQMSTATIYAHRFHAPNDERTGIIGGTEPDVPPEWRFSIEVAQAWEREVDLTICPATRKVKLRSAMVMTPEHGGAFEKLLRHVRLGFGRFGDGRQYMSWIHAEDFVRAVRWLIGHREIAGAVNLAAPQPLPNAEFMNVLCEAWGTHLAVPVPEWMVRIGAALIGTEPELILKSRRVVPRRLLESGFEFRFAEWPEAARDLCERRRRHDGVVGEAVPSY